jgi:hemerythrin-like metal-binding protein
VKGTRLEWGDQYLVGVSEIDEQHQQLIEMLNEFYDGLSQRRGRESLERLLRRMLDYARDHFATEEELMEQYDAPGSESHKKQHQRFLDRAVEMTDRLMTAQLLIPLEVTGFLRAWLARHIQVTDKALGRFLTEQGVK